jgi:hypothetical protein
MRGAERMDFGSVSIGFLVPMASFWWAFFPNDSGYGAIAKPPLWSACPLAWYLPCGC